MKAKRSSKAQHLSKDRISNLPSAIIETILCLLPIREAARASSLSKEWRYKWTKIPNLEFRDHYSFRELTNKKELSRGLQEPVASERRKMGERCKLFYAIYQILLMRRGPIHEFTLHMVLDKTCVEIDHIISYLSSDNAVRKLQLQLFNQDGGLYRIPSSIFSLHHLVDLYLRACDLTHQPTFNGFGSLTTLYLKNVCIPAKSLLHFLSKCPLLKTITLLLHEDYVICDENYTIVELFKCIPMVEHLTTWDRITECYVLDSVPHVLPTSLIHLKYIFFDYRADGLRLLAHLIRCSPNLEKIEIQMTQDHFSDEINSIISKAYSHIRLEHLTELEILGFGNLKPDLEFVKFILAKSRELKKIRLYLFMAFDRNEAAKMSRVLLHSPPASPVVRIIVSTETGDVRLV